MTREDAISIMNVIVHMLEEKYDTDRVEDAVDMAIKALKQEPCEDESSSEKPNNCEDAISRQAVLDMVEDITDQFGNKHRVVTEGMISLLPPATPKPKTDVLDKIRAEIHATAEMHEDGDYYLRDEWIDEIIDKHKAEGGDT